MKIIEFNQHTPMQAPNHQQYIIEMGMFFWIVILKDKLTLYNTIMTQDSASYIIQQTHNIPDLREEPLEALTKCNMLSTTLGIMYHATGFTTTVHHNYIK